MVLNTYLWGLVECIFMRKSIGKLNLRIQKITDVEF